MTGRGRFGLPRPLGVGPLSKDQSAEPSRYFINMYITPELGFAAMSNRELGALESDITDRYDSFTQLSRGNVFASTEQVAGQPSLTVEARVNKKVTRGLDLEVIENIAAVIEEEVDNRFGVERVRRTFVTAGRDR